MIDLTDDEKRQVLGEVLTDQLQAIFEYVKDIPKIKDDVNELKEKSDKIESRLIVVEAVTKAHEAELKTVKKQLATA